MALFLDLSHWSTGYLAMRSRRRKKGRRRRRGKREKGKGKLTAADDNQPNRQAARQLENTGARGQT
eukprot:9011741-Pyramimonas_sp.AAC.1